MQNTQYWAVIPAAGVGRRMQADRPKQYLPLCNKTVIEHTLDRFLSMDEITGVVLSIDEADEYWSKLSYTSHKSVLISKGGKERCDSVLNALTLLDKKTGASESVGVLVHDAARPCVRTQDIQKLIQSVGLAHDGGLLALPVRDTMKRSANSGLKKNRIDETVERDGLWHALTPQMFRLDLLIDALKKAQQKKLQITDDASAMELAGYCPELIEGHEDNIKITRGFDLQLAQIFLQNQSY